MASVAVHHELTGPPDAPALVLSGSLGSTLQMWDPQVDALAGRYRIVCYDHRGHGRSPVPAGSYAMAELAGDVRLLLDRLEIERAAFCGLSLGGMVGICLAAYAPERVSSLVLCSTTAHFDDSGPWHERAATVRWAGTAAVADQVVERWYTPDWAAQHQDVVDRSKQMIVGTSDEGYSSCCGAIAAWDGRKLLGRILAPTLVIGGAQDLATPVTPHAKTLTAAIAGSRLVVLDSAHVVTQEQAKRVNDLITEHVTAG